MDCCIDKPETRALWEQVFVNVLQGLPVLRVIVTHMHPDHIGLAHWLCERFGVRMWISGTDFTVARLASQAPSSFGGSPAAAFFALHGWVDVESQNKLKDRSSYFASLVPTVPNSHRRMMDGDSFMIGKRRSNVSIVQPPLVPLNGTSITPLILVIGTVLSLCGAALVAFLSALWRDTFLTPEQVERELGIPLLAAIPESES